MGIHMSKGPVRNVNGQNIAEFTINTTSNPLPAYNRGMINGGMIMDQQGDGDQKSAIPDKNYQWLSYSVITPQNQQERYGTRTQNVSRNQTRNLPKIGASYYPTVGFKVIGFERNPIYNNLRGASTLKQTKTYIPANTTPGRHDSLLSPQAPFYELHSIIDLSLP